MTHGRVRTPDTAYSIRYTLVTFQILIATVCLTLTCKVSIVLNCHSQGRRWQKVGVLVVLLFLLLHTNCTCGIIYYVHVRRTDRQTESARSRLSVVRGVQKWGGWAPPCKNLGGGGGGGPSTPCPPYFSAPDSVPVKYTHTNWKLQN